MVFRLTKRMPEVLRDPKLQQDLQFHKPTAKDAKVTCIAIRDMRFAVEWPQLIATQRFGRGFRPLEGVDPDQYQTITDSIQVLPTMLMAQVTSSFLPVRRSPIPNVMNVMYKGFEIDVRRMMVPSLVLVNVTLHLLLLSLGSWTSSLLTKLLR